MARRDEVDPEDVIIEMREVVEAMKEKIAQQDEVLRELTTPPFQHATVLRFCEPEDDDDERTVLIAHGSETAEVLMPKLPRGKRPITLGCVVRIAPGTGAIVKVMNNDDAMGEITTVTRVRSKNFAEVDLGGGTRIVAYQLATKLEEGDRVILDTTGGVIVKWLGKDETAHAFTAETKVRWKDIGGLEEAKQALIEAIELPVKHADLYAKYGKSPVKGVLLSGPPGCGKTLLAKAAASSLADTHGGKGRETAFIYVKGPELLNMYVGNTESGIRSLFARAREHQKKNGYPAIIFIDEADALLGRRGDHANSSLNHTVVPQFLSEMDGLDVSGALVLLATNRADILDSAIVRDGRIDRKVRVTRPDRKTAEAIFRIHVKGKPLASGLDVEAFSAVAAEALYSDKFVLYEVQTKDGKVLPFALSDLANGAMVAGVVDQCSTLALRRDIGSRKVSGMSKDDIAATVLQVFRQNRDLDHNEVLQDFCEGFRDSVSDIRRVPSAPATNGHGKPTIAATT